jgi:hypothetical protein
VKPLIFKALLRLSDASGIHPRCLPLSGLDEVGEQLAGGGFGDIRKGLVDGQSVCLKIMRIFEDATIKAALKVFFSETPNFLINVYTGIWSRSFDLATAVPPERASLFRYLPSGQETVSSLAMDGVRQRHAISNSPQTNRRRTSLSRNHLFRRSKILVNYSC